MKIIKSNFKKGDKLRLKTRGRNAIKEVPILEYVVSYIRPKNTPHISINTKFLFSRKDIATFIRFGDEEDHRKTLRVGMWVLFNEKTEYIDNVFWEHFIKI